MDSPKKRVFISYASEEEVIAKKIEDLIIEVFGPSVDVFTSASGVRAGQIWFKRIGDEARNSDLLIVICSPFSISRMWLSFEAGAAWSREISIIPVCHSGLTRLQLPDPFRHFHGLEIPTPEFPKQLVSEISIELSIDTPPIDSAKYTQELKLAMQIVESQVKPFDVFISTPLAGIPDKQFREAFLIEMRKVITCVAEQESLHKFHYCLDTIENFSLNQPPFMAADITIDTLRQSKKFLMIVPQENLPSSCFVEAGIALALNIPSVYFIKSPRCLPNLLRDVRSAAIGIAPFEEMSEIVDQIQQNGSALWRNTTAWL